MSETTTTTTPATPNNMPGAAPASETPSATPAAEPEKTAEPTKTPEATATPATAGGLNAEERAELERLRAVHKDESKWENRSKANAKKLRDLAAAAGLDVSELNLSEFDPKVEFEKLSKTVESEREARIRAEVAREFPDLDPADIHGSTEDEMRSSAQKQKDRIDEAVKKALEAVDASRPTSSAAPASTVTSSEKVTGPKQIESRAELAKMTPAEIVKADQEGRLNKLKKLQT
jgi:hypothetical protein